MEAKLHFITSKLQFKYIDMLQTLKEKGKVSTSEYIKFVEGMEYILDSLASGLTLKQQQDLKEETGKMLEHVSNILYDSIHNPSDVPEQLEYYYYFDKDGIANLIDTVNPRKVIHQFIDEPMPGLKRLPPPHIVIEPKPKKTTFKKKMVSQVKHIKASKSLTKDVKKLFTKYTRIQNTIYNGLDKVDSLKTIKGRMNKVEKLLGKLVELENIKNQIISVGDTSEYSKTVEEEVRGATEYLYTTLNDKYMELEAQLKPRKYKLQ